MSHVPDDFLPSPRTAADELSARADRRRLRLTRALGLVMLAVLGWLLWLIYSLPSA